MLSPGHGYIYLELLRPELRNLLQIVLNSNGCEVIAMIKTAHVPLLVVEVARRNCANREPHFLHRHRALIMPLLPHVSGDMHCLRQLAALVLLVFFLTLGRQLHVHAHRRMHTEVGPESCLCA